MWGNQMSFFPSIISVAPAELRGRALSKCNEKTRRFGKSPPVDSTWSRLGIITLQKYALPDLLPSPNYWRTAGPLMDQKTVSICLSLAIVCSTRTGREQGAHRRTPTIYGHGSDWNPTMPHPQLLAEQSQKFLPFAVVPAICDISRLFSLSVDMSVRATPNENDQVSNRESRANEIKLELV
jgi:hypothetical protein